MTPSGHYATGPVPKIAYHRLELSGTGLAMKRREFIAALRAARWRGLSRHRGNRRLQGLLVFLHLDRSQGTRAAFAPAQGRLAEMGYVEGRNLAVEYRAADSQEDRLAALADDLVHRRVM